MVKELEEEEQRDQQFNERIDMIDKIITGDEETIKILKNSIIEIDEGEIENETVIEIFIHSTKIKKKVMEKGTIKYEFLISWRIMKNLNRSGDLFFTFINNSGEENEYRIILRALIVSLLLIPRNQKIKLYINKNVQTLINRFLNNMSDRRKLDNEYYLELQFIGNFIKNNGLIWLQGNKEADSYDKALIIEINKDIKK